MPRRLCCLLNLTLLWLLLEVAAKARLRLLLTLHGRQWALRLRLVRTPLAILAHFQRLVVLSRLRLLLEELLLGPDFDRVREHAADVCARLLVQSRSPHVLVLLLELREQVRSQLSCRIRLRQARAAALFEHLRRLGAPLLLLY